MTYREAVERLDNGIKKDVKKIANNTWLVRHQGYIGVRLHNTEVVEIYPKYYRLYSGGWYTVTTKARINEYSPALLYQEAGRWYVRGHNVPEDISIFYEGMAVDIYGHPLNTKHLSKSEDKKTKALKAKIAKYVKLCGVKFKAGLPLPSGGDCWYCALKSQDHMPLGDTIKDNDHLLSHMSEGYVVPSLLANAVIEAGYNMPGYILMVDPDHNRMGGEHASDWAVTNSVRKYLNKRLLPAGVIGKSDNHSTGWAGKGAR